ncbi:MAG: hypothetical protein JJE35_10815 [Thermoleophilia bacterium]|nr:hypothetical protein [Thermoleophilia bacterium]
MPRFEISSEQRAALYEQTRNHLAALGDVFIALERDDDPAAAERLGRQFADDLRLLGDLGWDRSDDCSSFNLTMSALDLRRVLMRLQAEAEGGVTEPVEERRAREEEAQAAAAFVAARNTCREILDNLDAHCEGQSAACS